MSYCCVGKSTEVKHRDSLGQGAARARSRKPKRRRWGGSMGLPGGSAPAGPELSQILHGARAGSAGSPVSLPPVGTLKALLSTLCLCSLCPDKKKTAPRPSAGQLLPAQVTATGARQRNPHTAQLLLHSARAKLTPLSTSGSTTAAGDTRSFCREREIPPEPVGQVPRFSGLLKAVALHTPLSRSSK